MPALGNPRREAFCRAYVSGRTAGIGGDSYLAAGFKCSKPAASVAANRLLKTANVSDRVAELHAQATEIEDKATAVAIEKLGLDKEWVLSRLVYNVERSMQTEAVKGPDGQPTGEYRYNGNAANKALELLGKHLGMFVSAGDTHNLQVNQGVAFVDKPPVETRAEWEARRRQELRPQPGDGKVHS